MPCIIVLNALFVWYMLLFMFESINETGSELSSYISVAVNRSNIYLLMLLELYSHIYFFCTSVYLFVFPFTILFYVIVIHARYANVLKTFRECLTLCWYISNFNYNHIFIFSVHVLDVVMNLPIGHRLRTHAVQIVHLLCLIIVTTMIKSIWWLITLQWATRWHYWRTPLKPIQCNMLSTFMYFVILQC